MIRVRAQSPTCLCLERSERNGEKYENDYAVDILYDGSVEIFLGE